MKSPLFQIPERLRLLKKYYALSVVLQEEVCTVHGYLIREESDGGFFIEDTFSGIALDVFLDTRRKDYPVILNLEGTGILSKKVKRADGYLQRLIFRGNLEEFYFYEKQESNDIYVSYSRMERVLQIIDIFKKANFFVTSLTLGPFVIHNILPFLGLKKYKTLAYTVTVEENSMSTFVANTTEDLEHYTFQNEVIPSHSLAAFSGYFDMKAQGSNMNASLDILNFNKEELFYKNILKRGGIAGLVIILGLLIMGHFIKSAKVDELFTKQSEITFIQQQEQGLSNLLKDKQSKEQILLNSGFSRSSAFSTYISEITNILPNEIVLNQLEIQPLSRKLKPNEPIVFKADRIVVLGTSPLDTVLDEWISSLNELSGITKVEITKLERNRQGLDVFELGITIR